MTTIGFVGAGNMACALGGGLKLTDSSAGPTRLVATDVEEKALASFVAETGGAVFERASDVRREADVVILAVKPQVLPALLAELAPLVEPRHLVISIAAGITLAALSRGLGERTRIVRAMPNTPALIREGMTVLVAGAADAEAMLRAGERAGLPPDLALRLLQQTLIGSALLWRESGDPVEKLRAMVTSPGGTTQAGLEALAAGGFERAIGDAIESATRRSRELSGGGKA